MNEVTKLRERIALLQQQRAGTYEVRFDTILNWMEEILDAWGCLKHGPPPEAQFKELFERVLDERNKAEKWAAAEAVSHHKTAKQLADMQAYAGHLEKKLKLLEKLSG